jgi:hypothetical protein
LQLYARLAVARGKPLTGGDLCRRSSPVRANVPCYTARARDDQMRRPYLAAVIAIILLAACNYDRGSRAVTREPQGPPIAPAPAATEPAPTVESRTGPQPAASVAGSAPQVPAANAPAPGAAPTARVASSPPGQSGPGTSKAQPSKPAAGPVSAPALPAPVTAAAAATTPPASPSKAAAPQPLDLKGLELRLRDTRAIGLFTKLSLKNQVDDLLAQFKAFHQGPSGITIGQLRQKYELLLMKVVTLLQDGDAALASAVSASREAIWNVLTDPQKFAAIAYST